MGTQQDGDILRILVSSDNHLGVWEKDEIRKHDSFAAFDEVLQQALEMNVDLVLLGGDLFHENKPSRSTLVRTIDIIKKYCFCDKPVRFQILSEQDAFVSGIANYQDPNLNVGLPIFTIHGNHDDPGGAENLSAVDILSSCGLVNYFGKTKISGESAHTTGKISIAPILMQKGETKLALYGLGNIRDERLGRLFQTAGAVTWLQPDDAPGYPRTDWFNIFTLHQNRVTHGPKTRNYVQESQFPGFLDLVVWGHEHECKPDLEPVVNPNVNAEDKATPTQILQPGSTVATALSEGEAARKHYFVVDIKGQQWRHTRYALQSQRPFAYEAVTLRDVTLPAPLNPENPDSINGYLESKVNSLIKKVTARQPDVSNVMLPLIRIKVDYTGFSTINAQRFGQKFVGKVANPHDMLTWSKAPQRREKVERGEEITPDLLRPEAMDQARIEDLIAENLHDNLKFLKEEELANALHKFVDKDEKHALAECVTQELSERLQASMARRVFEQTQANDEDLRSQLASVVKEERERKGPHPSASELITQRELSQIARDSAGVQDRGAGGPSGAAITSEQGPMPPPSTATTRGGRGGRGRGAKATAASKPTTGRGRGRGGGRQATLADTLSRRASTSTQAQPSEEEDLDDAGTSRASARPGKRTRPAPVEEDDVIESDDGPAPSASRSEALTPNRDGGTAAGRPRRAAAQKKRQRVNVEDEEADDDPVVSDGDEDYSVKGNDQDDIDDDEDLIVDEDEGMPSTSRRKAPASRAKQPAKSKVASRGRARPGPAPSHPTEDVIISSDEEPAPSGRTQQPPASMQPTPSSSLGGAVSGRPAGRALPGSLLSQGTSQSKGGGGKSGWGKAR